MLIHLRDTLELLLLHLEGIGSLHRWLLFLNWLRLGMRLEVVEDIPIIIVVISCSADVVVVLLLEVITYSIVLLVD